MLPSYQSTHAPGMECTPGDIQQCNYASSRKVPSERANLTSAPLRAPPPACRAAPTARHPPGRARRRRRSPAATPTPQRAHVA
eukprot:5990138-Prymnesium_polylepis.1